MRRPARPIRVLEFLVTGRPVLRPQPPCVVGDRRGICAGSSCREAARALPARNSCSPVISTARGRCVAAGAEMNRGRRQASELTGPSVGTEPPPQGGWGRAVGLGLITGAADDDPSYIGTYVTAVGSIETSLL